MNDIARDRLNRLRTRATFLRGRIESLETQDRIQRDRDRAELSALEWAVEIIEDWMPEHHVTAQNKTRVIRRLNVGLAEVIGIARDLGMDVETEQRVRRHLQNEADAIPEAGCSR